MNYSLEISEMSPKKKKIVPYLTKWLTHVRCVHKVSWKSVHVWLLEEWPFLIFDIIKIKTLFLHLTMLFPSLNTWQNKWIYIKWNTSQYDLKNQTCLNKVKPLSRTVWMNELASQQVSHSSPSGRISCGVTLEWIIVTSKADHLYLHYLKSRTIF